MGTALAHIGSVRKINCRPMGREMTVVACRTGRHVLCRHGACLDASPLAVTRSALSWRTLEHPSHMTAAAVDQGMCPGQWETGGKVLECFICGTGCHERQRQHDCQKQTPSLNCCCLTHFDNPLLVVLLPRSILLPIKLRSANLLVLWHLSQCCPNSPR